MKRQYDGLTAMKIDFTNTDIATVSNGCSAMIQLRMENGICVSPDYQQQIEYVGDKG